MQPRQRNILLAASVIGAVLLVIGGAYLTLVLISASLFPNETTDVSRYDAVLAEWQGTGLVAHFPPAVPSSAQNVRFSAYPGQLQAGAYVQLRLQLPADEIERIEAQLSQSTTHVYTGGGKYDHYNRDQDNNVATAQFRTADDPAGRFSFPEHYTLYVLHARDHSAGSWNHGETRGAAVSTTTNEVIYWAESW